VTGTARLGFPFLSVGQSQKEAFHNEALQILDMLVGSSVKEAPRSAPPASPAPGDGYIVAASPSGAWAGKPQCVAAYSTGGWRFVTPVEGLSAYVQSSGLWATFRAGNWEIGTARCSNLMVAGQQVVGGRLTPISSPTGGTNVDAQARTAIDQILGAMRQHGLIET
jgi:hypothetical protein